MCHVTFFGPFLNNNFPFCAVCSIEKARILENDNCHVTRLAGGLGGVVQVSPNNSRGGGVKNGPKNVSYNLNSPL